MQHGGNIVFRDIPEVLLASAEVNEGRVKLLLFDLLLHELKGAVASFSMKLHRGVE